MLETICLLALVMMCIIEARPNDNYRVISDIKIIQDTDKVLAPEDHLFKIEDPVLEAVAKNNNMDTDKDLPNNSDIQHEIVKRQNELKSDENLEDELMDVAESIVFRPLFTYRSQVAQRRRVSRRNLDDSN